MYVLYHWTFIPWMTMLWESSPISGAIVPPSPHHCGPLWGGSAESRSDGSMKEYTVWSCTSGSLRLSWPVIQSECSAWATVLHYVQNIPPAAMEVIVRISASSGFQPDGAMIILSPALQFRLELPSTAMVASPSWALLASLVHDGDLRTPWIDSCRIAGYYSKWKS